MPNNIKSCRVSFVRSRYADSASTYVKTGKAYETRIKSISELLIWESGEQNSWTYAVVSKSSTLTHPETEQTWLI